jgi:hypothetical protein
MSGVIVGAHLVVFINGKRFGECTGMEWEQGTPHTERMGVDSLTPVELVPVATRVNGSFQALRIRATGGLEGRGIVAPFRHLSREKHFSILVIDRRDGTRVFRADRCSVTSQRWRVQAKGRLEGTFSFMGIDASNEIDAAYG